MTFKKTKLAMAVATATLAMASSSAMAHSKAERIADATAKKTAALEAQVQQMASMMQAMQAELSRVKAQASTATTTNTAKLQELDQWMSSVRSAPVHVASKDSLVSVRGGWYRFNDNRGSTASTAGSGIGIDILTSETDHDAFYYGGAFDFNVNNDLFGFMDHTSFGVEFGFEYTEIAQRKVNGLGTALTALHGTPALQSVTVNMLRINASPKIKFFHGSKFRPWIIPVGLDVNIISPPSDAITVLNTGMNFGLGAEYEVFNGIVVGADGRYHHSFDDVDGVDTDGFTLGGSIGFKF